jgi:putative ABC transport system permease protein
VLKTLGFTDAAVLSLVLAESLFVAIVGGGLGLFVAWLIVLGGDPTGGFLPAFTLPTRDLVAGVVLILLVGIAAGLLPAAGAMRLKITDALRKA